MSAECQICGTDLSYDFKCALCEARAEAAELRKRLKRVQDSERFEHERGWELKEESAILREGLLQMADSIGEALRKGGLRDAPEHAEAILKDAHAEACRLARAALGGSP